MTTIPNHDPTFEPDNETPEEWLQRKQFQAKERAFKAPIIRERLNELEFWDKTVQTLLSIGHTNEIEIGMITSRLCVLRRDYIRVQNDNNTTPNS